MREWQFNNIKNLITDIYKDDDSGYMDDWWHLPKTLEYFNKNYNIKVGAFLWKVFNATILYWRPQTTKTSGFLHINFSDGKL